MNDTTREKIYRRLADFLNTMPDGYPPSTTGADLRVLERLFAPEEAELAIHLTMERESAAVIARRAGVPTRDAAARLAEMAKKGLVFSVERAGKLPLYQAVPFVVGIYEFQVNDLTPDLLKDLYEYALTRGTWPRVKSIPQLRTVPIGLTLDSHAEALPYERVGELVNAHDRFAVAHCICRKVAKMAGQGCDAPEETCLFFGDWADYYVTTGRGRAITREEVFAILKQANEANLVLQPSNTKTAAVICCCCGCCCGGLAPLKQLERPADEVASSYRVAYDRSLCVGCHKCLTRCQMGALQADGDRIQPVPHRCIGCGLCVATCSSGALTLVRRETPREVPDDIADMWKVMRKALADADGRAMPK